MGKAAEATTFEKVRDILCEVTGAGEPEVTEDAGIVDDLGADSLDVVEIALALEEDFNIEIQDDDMLAARRVRDVVALVDRRVAARKAGA